MAIDIVRGAIKNVRASEALISVIRQIDNDYNGTLFLAYPLSADKDGNIITVDALLITKEKGLVAFIFESKENYADEQDRLFYQLTNTLNGYESLRAKRRLAFDPIVITLFASDDYEELGGDYIFASSSNLAETIKELDDFDPGYYEKLTEALQKISSMKPKKKRGNVKEDLSRGSIMKEIEKQTANLDKWQKQAAFEVPDGPQRIRGLAGSGKTVVLALKAAYLHSQWPDWHIAVTFYTRALSQQFKEMITNFSREFIGDEPDWNHLRVLHSWGTYAEDGIYSIACREMNIIPVNYSNAKVKYGSARAFAGICDDALQESNDKEYPIYDAILIDEAQDMPPSFFQLCYKLAKKPKRIVFAYDELQNLAGNNMPSLKEMFGANANGETNVQLINHEKEARQDIVLPICYRNTPWSLTLAHALGFGIYRRDGLVQLFSDFGLWEDIGYRLVSGELQYDCHVSLKRSSDSAPVYFKELLSPDDTVQIKSFQDKKEQYRWVVEQIYTNITKDELDPDDILVIFPDPYYTKSDYAEFREFLMRRRISSNLVGVGTNRDTFKVEGSITCSHVYRAKGNEAPMVYIVNSDYCAQSIELRKARNILFTSITRSRAWVRVCGVGENMQILENEANLCIKNGYTLSFKIPTEKELLRLNLIHRDRSEQEIKEMKKASELARDLNKLVAKGIDFEQIPEMAELIKTLRNSEDLYGEDE